MLKQSVTNYFGAEHRWERTIAQACRAQSAAEFRSKLGICEEEADEALFWLEMITELGYINANLLNELIHEANAILSMIVASIKTSRRSR